MNLININIYENFWRENSIYSSLRTARIVVINSEIRNIGNGEVRTVYTYALNAPIGHPKN